MINKSLVRDIVKAMRGERSQMQMSARLKFTFNQVYRWEAGKARFLWSDFANVCRSLKIDLAATLETTLRFAGDPKDGAALVEHLVRGTNLGAAAKNLGVSRFKLQRWIAGNSAVPFEAVLSLLQQTDSLLAFLGRIVPLEKIPSLAGLSEQRARIGELFLKYPALGALLMLLKSDDYLRLPAHRSAWISEMLGIHSGEIDDILRAAESAGLIEKAGTRFRPVDANHNTRNYPDAERAMREYWIKRGLEADIKRAGRASAERGIFGFLIVSLSEDQTRRAREALIDFNNAIMAIAAEPGEKTKSMVLNLQMFPLLPPA